MRVVSHRKLKEFYETPGREDSKIALERWYHLALDAEWSDIRGNRYRLVVVIKFIMGYVFIRFVGSHEEYDKINAKEV